MEERERSVREYVQHIIMSVNKTRARRKELEQDIQKWKNRAAEAEKMDRSDLLSKAQIRVQDLEFELGGIKAEEAELEQEMKKAKSEITEARIKDGLNVDASALLQNLASMTGGEPDPLEQKFADQEADSALEALKQKMKQDGEL